MRALPAQGTLHTLPRMRQAKLSNVSGPHRVLLLEQPRLNESSVALPFYKGNGAIHWRKCAEFYGAKSGSTAREWYCSCAPIAEPEKMREWLQAREDERLQKIAKGNMRYLPKEPEIVRLHTEEKWGTRAISKYFSGSPSGPAVREILIRNGVYRGNETYQKQIQDSQKRKALLLQEAKVQRHRIATCLWLLRKGIGVETTCRQNGWSKSSVWNALAERRSYKKFKARRNPKWKDKRIYGRQYSRMFPKEALFQNAITKVLKNSGAIFVVEARLAGTRTRVDFKLSDGTFVELKVGLSSGQCYEFIGQAVHYRKHTKRIVLCIPSDIQFRRDLHELIVELGVIICNENTLAVVLRGELPPAESNQVIPQRASDFVCKCCGSSEKRRRNSCCVDCAPLIPQMRFDVATDRWLKLAE